jgi:hypothetical protein
MWQEQTPATEPHLFPITYTAMVGFAQSSLDHSCAGANSCHGQPHLFFLITYAAMVGFVQSSQILHVAGQTPARQID